MARNGSGTYNLVSGNPVVTGTTISSTWANNTLNDIATALSGSIAADGQTPITANLPMAGYKHTNVAAGSLLTDYVRIDQLQNSSIIWLTSVTGTDTITASSTITPAAYAAGQVFRFVSAGTNTTTTSSLNINSLGAKTITKKGDANIQIGDLPANAVITVVYNGTNFQIIGIETRQFRIYATATPSMSLIIDAGNIQQQTTLTSIAKQTTTAFVAPVTNPRNDLIVLDETTGAYSIVAGTEAASPADPAIPANKIVLARVRLTVGMTSINSTNFDDLLPLYYANGISQTFTDTRYGSAMFPATASTTSNLITFSLAPCKIDFRNVNPVIGTPTEYNVTSTLNLTMTSIAGSLGFTTAVQGRIAVALVYAAGTPQIAIAAISGGLQMDETNLITTAAIGAGSTSATAWYSTSAIATSSQYRIIGFVDATWTSGTGWSSPAAVQPAGGLAMTNVVGSKWSDVTASRSASVTYTNTSPNLRKVSISCNNIATSGGLAISVDITSPDGTTTSHSNGAPGAGLASNNAPLGMFFDVPPYNKYIVTFTSVTLIKWNEMTV